MKDLINCPAERAIYFLGGKWKIRILFTLYNNKKVRFNELKKVLKTITQQKIKIQEKPPNMGVRCARSARRMPILGFLFPGFLIFFGDFFLYNTVGRLLKNIRQAGNQQKHKKETTKNNINPIVRGVSRATVYPVTLTARHFLRAGVKLA